MSPRFASEVAPPDALYSRIRAKVETTPASTLSTRARIILALAIVPFLSAGVVLIGSQFAYDRSAVRFDLVTQPTFYLRLALLVLTGLTLLASLVALRRRSHGLGSGAVALLLVAGLVTPLYAALTFGSSLLSDTCALPDAMLSPWGRRCLVIALAVGTLVLACFTLALRRSVPVASRLRGAAVGAAAGAWGGLSVFVFCPAGEPLHLFIGHVLPLVAFTLLGILCIPRALRP